MAQRHGGGQPRSPPFSNPEDSWLFFSRLSPAFMPRNDRVALINHVRSSKWKVRLKQERTMLMDYPAQFKRIRVILGSWLRQRRGPAALYLALPYRQAHVGFSQTSGCLAQPKTSQPQEKSCCCLPALKCHNRATSRDLYWGCLNLKHRPICKVGVSFC